MPTKIQKLTLEIYGLARLILGVGQLVGLSAGYFLIEFVLKSAPSSLFVIDQEMLALVYLAVLLRAVFHLAAGIGIARIQEWGRVWLQLGWPIMLIITVGLGYSFSQELLLGGHIKSTINAILWPKLLLYFLWIAVDYIFVCSWIEQWNNDPALLKKEGGRLDGKKVGLVFLIAVFCFSLLMFLGRPIKEGFHQGFYKRGTKQAMKDKETPVLDPVSPTTAADKDVAKQQEQGAGSVIDAVFHPGKIEQAPLMVDEQSEKKKEILSSEKGEVESGMPYTKTIGYAAGFCLVLALILPLVEMLQNGRLGPMPVSAYTLLGFGFLLWLIYGLAVKLTPITLTGFFGLIISAMIIVNHSRED